MTERAAVRLPKKANYRGLKITFAKHHFAFIFSPDVSLPSKATSCNWRSDGFQGQSSLRNAWSVAQCLSQDLTLFSQEPIARFSF